MNLRPGSVLNNLWQTGSAVRAGIVLGIASAAGTLFLQRPLTDPEELARAYSPEKLRWLDRLGLTDVVHSWWFAALLALLCTRLFYLR